jgi:hypothetical protein
MQALNGPWTFQITSSMLALQPLPTPAASGGDCLDIGVKSPPILDCYSGVSAILAQKLVGFPVIEPTPLPSSLTREDFDGTVYRLGSTNANRPNYVSLDYHFRSGQPGVWLVETTDHAAVPNVNGGTVSSVMPFALDDSRLTHTIRPGTLKTMSIDGVTVTQFELGDTNSPRASFVWTQSGVSYAMSSAGSDDIGTPTPVVTDADLLPLVTSIIEQSSARITSTPTSPASPQAARTPNAAGNYVLATLAQAQQLAPFQLAQPSWIPSYLDDPDIVASDMIDASGEVTQTSPAGPVQAVNLVYHDSAEDDAALVTIREVKQGSALAQANGTPTPLTIAGHMVSRTISSDPLPPPAGIAGYSGNNASYVWTDQGTTFELDAMMAGPITEQDIEHMIASMIAPGS